MERPVIAIPLGDPAGVGPEIVVKALASPRVNAAARCVVIGDRGVLKNACLITGMASKINVVSHPAEGDYRAGILNLLPMDNIDMSKLQIGQISGMCGRAAYETIAKSVELALAGFAGAVATPPINKEALRAGGVDFIGHTEIFGALTDTPDPLTMFETRGLRVFFLSRHVSLRKACDMVTKERIVNYVKRCTQMLAKLGVTGGVMAIAGLNPHSGEHGLFGDEELTAIYPAIQQLQGEGYAVEGPIGADSVFHLALQGRYNSVLSMYHDQGHIAAKTYDFERTVSVTGGMPILRTSVDHGTAMDIAGKNLASPVSMTEAILVAARYAPYFAKQR